jgi:hypothetical protein
MLNGILVIRKLFVAYFKPGVRTVAADGYYCFYAAHAFFAVPQKTDGRQTRLFHARTGSGGECRPYYFSCTTTIGYTYLLCIHESTEYMATDGTRRKEK